MATTEVHTMVLLLSLLFGRGAFLFVPLTSTQTLIGQCAHHSPH